MLKWLGEIITEVREAIGALFEFVKEVLDVAKAITMGKNKS